MTLRWIAPILALMFAACGGSQAASKGASGTSALGTVVIVRGDNLVLIKPDGTQLSQVTRQEPNTFANNPAFSPDGTLLVYSHHVAPNGPDFGGAEIHVIEVGGSDHRVLAPYKSNGERAEYPVWSADGKSVYYAHDIPIFDQAGQYTGDTLTVEKVGVASGRVEVVAKDAIFPATSPSGDMAWVNFNLTDSSFQFVFVPQSGSPRPLLTDQDFQAVYMPRFSPDGKTLLFGGSGRTDSKVASMGRAVAKALNPLVPEAAEAHGLPWDPWVIGIDGHGLKKLTGIGLDELGMAWSPDGKQIMAANLDATYLFKADGSGFTHLLKTGDPGGIDWRR